MCDLVYSYRSLDTMRDTMPQTVPSAGFSPPCDYSNFAADCFDLSLLPSPDGEVPYSPVNLFQVMSFYSDPTTSPPSMFPSGAPDDFHSLKAATNTTTSTGSTTTSTPTSSMASCTSDPFHFQAPATNTIKEEPISFLSREPSCSYMTSPYAPLSASPMPSSPAGSTSSSSTSYQRCPSPAIKPEQTIDLQDILQESRALQESLDKKKTLGCADDRILRESSSPSFGSHSLKKEDSASCSTPEGTGSDHRLLREVLRDTSFQRRYNWKPFEFSGLTAGFMSEGAAGQSQQTVQPTEVKLEEGEALLSREKMEPVLSLAIEQLRKDVGDTCSVLGIAPDPTRWAAGDVRSWLLWTLRQYALPMVPMEYFDMDGAALTALTEQDFQQRAPQCGSTLFAQLEIWKAACQDLDIQWNNGNTSSSSSGDASEDEDEEVETPAASVGGGKSTSSRPGGSGGGSHIHLWQFLKELLSSPQLHGSCIRWLDRSKGVFKIEDSVRVARLWGKRKNRPAMNYDKLSRSIRQYYKKGIMKKTERSQRLVYQFCHPYCL
ncbi:DNA-binding protein D-ETS-4 [Anabrus simplex]|uniref:DNA-binding protein D-ETS-4 n=1 Tax=Anabrus simplex TaxID=316456 RepID=UPI0035A2C86A